MIETKCCPHCRITKPVAEFYKHTPSANGLHSWCKQCMNEAHTQYLDRLKEEVLTYYGHGNLVCVRCGLKDIRALTIDHIEGGGTKHRQLTGMNGGVALYSWLKRQRFPSGYQTLCGSCQMIKEVEKRNAGAKSRG